MDLRENHRSERRRVRLRAQGEIHRVPVSEGIILEESGWQLAVRPINVRRQRTGKRPLVDVSDHAHDRFPRVPHAPADALPDGILTRPELPCERLTDNSHGLSFEPVFRPKRPAPEKRNAHRLKVVRQHPRLTDRLRRFVFAVASLDDHRNHFTRTQGQIAGDPSRLHARQI